MYYIYIIKYISIFKFTFCVVFPVKGFDEYLPSSQNNYYYSEPVFEDENFDYFDDTAVAALGWGASTRRIIMKNNY
jgi:hypothetical protein